MEHKNKGVRMGGGDSLCAEFPPHWQDFIKQYAQDVRFFDKDLEQTIVVEMIPSYRVMQMMCYYLGREAGTNPEDLGGGKPHE